MRDQRQTRAQTSLIYTLGAQKRAEVAVNCESVECIVRGAV